ncbi:MAG: hypothetical protein GY851_23585 [bacterium]|nr:hypothetical protein [bacterium]
MTRSSLALALLLTVGVAWAQEPEHEAHEEPGGLRGELEALEGLEPLPDFLPELIEIAMMHNPEVLQAKAALAQAKADLYRAQLEVAREVTSLAAERDELRRQAERLSAMVAEGIAPNEPKQKHRASLAQLEAELRYAVGIGFPIPMEPPFMEEHREHFEPEMMRPVARPGLDTVPKEMAEVLASPVSIEFDESVTLEEMLSFVSEYQSINIVTELDVGEIDFKMSIDDTPLRDYLTALTDQCEMLAFVIRDYGILATTRERAMRIDAPAIPENLPLLKMEHHE